MRPEERRGEQNEVQDVVSNLRGGEPGVEDEDNNGDKDDRDDEAGVINTECLHKIETENHQTIFTLTLIQNLISNVSCLGVHHCEHIAKVSGIMC